MKNLIFILTCLLLPVCLSACSLAPQAKQKAAPLRVMTFNIRYHNRGDGPNAWPLRKKFTLKTITDYQPHILGLQEVLDDQAQDIKRQLPHYAFHGVGRDDGKKRGEYAPVLYRKDRFTLVDSGHFWLSEKPQTPGIVSWDSSQTRMASWVILRDKQNPHAQEIIVLNTHYDHIGQSARNHSSQIIANHLKKIRNQRHVLLLGDFNAKPQSHAHQILIQQLHLKDAHAHTADQNTGTYHGFTGQSTSGRIDWILYSGQLSATDSHINKIHNSQHRYPSDHFPVTTLIQYRNSSLP